MIVGVVDSCAEDEEETEGIFGVGDTLDDNFGHIVIITKLPPVTIQYLHHL